MVFPGGLCVVIWWRVFWRLADSGILGFRFWCLARLWSLWLLIGGMLRGSGFSLFVFAYCDEGLLAGCVFCLLLDGVAHHPGGFLNLVVCGLGLAGG